MELIDKEILLLIIDSKIEEAQKVFNVAPSSVIGGMIEGYTRTKKIINTLEVKDPYEQCAQYDSIKAGIQAHAETYSFNIESELFPQLTKEQQKLWRKEREMPIKPENKARYPKNWKEIRAQILKRANNRCEICGVENHSEYIRKKDGKVCRHVLTIAHIYDDSPENCDPDNLKALCCFCHNGMDAKMRAKHRKETIEKKKNNGVLTLKFDNL